MCAFLVLLVFLAFYFFSIIVLFSSFSVLSFHSCRKETITLDAKFGMLFSRPLCCRLCHLAPRFQPFCSTFRPLINFGKWQRALRRQGGVNSLDPSIGLYRLVITRRKIMIRLIRLSTCTLLVPSCTYWPVEYWISRKDSDPNSANPWCSLNVESCFSTPKTSIFWAQAMASAPKATMFRRFTGMFTVYPKPIQCIFIYFHCIFQQMA